MPHRTQPKFSSIRATSKDDGTTTLTSNANYLIKKLPALPSALRTAKSSSFRGSRVSPNGYALVLTRHSALIWDYATPSTAPAARSLALPHPTKSDEPIPLGAFVSSSPNDDTGLLVVNPVSGKISFWESIENADALSLFEQRRNGVEGSCGNMSYGETITDLTDASAAGFVLSFSSGRAAQLLLRDSQSRPSISVQFLRKATATSGFFDSLRSVFGSAGWLRSVAAVQTRPLSARGQMEAILCSEDAMLHFWHINWTGQAALQKEIDARSVLADAASQLFGPGLRSAANTAKVIQIALLSSSSSNTCSLLLLLSFGHLAKPSFALVSVEIGDEPLMRRAVLLHSYSPPVISHHNWKPKICVLNPNSTVVVVFDKAIVFADLGLRSSSSSDQVLLDAGQYSELFQDTVYFQAETGFAACGAAVEYLETRSSSELSLVVFVQNFGLLRVIALAHTAEDSSASRPQVTVKSKIEQAVYFGEVRSNPLDLTRKADFTFAPDEVEEAATSISKDILQSNSDFIPGVAPSVEVHLTQRAQYMETLASYLRRFYSDISRNTRWILRWDAERVAAARAIWTVCDARKRKGEKLMSLLSEMILSMDESHKSVMDTERGETDPVRHFFVKDLSSINVLFGLAWEQLKALESDDLTRDHDKLPELISEANDIVIKGLQAAFEFREASAELYGLEYEAMKDGLLIESYQGLPEFWTSTTVIWIPMPEQVDHIRELVNLATPDNFQLEQAAPNVRQLALDAVQLVDLYCKVSEERLRWEESRAATKDTDRLSAFRQSYHDNRIRLIKALPELFIELSDDGMRLAEKYSDLRALVGVISVKSDFLTDMLSSSEIDEKARAYAASEYKLLDQKISQYFKKYPGAFSQIMFSEMVENGQLHTLLNQAPFRGDELTNFLRRQTPHVKKFAWINEILSVKNQLEGAKQLMKVATEQETELWNKKVELSIAKLALKAGESQSKHEGMFKASCKAQSDAAVLVKIQEMVFEQVRPCLYHAVDETAELQLAMESYGLGTRSKKYPHLEELLERSMERLIQHKALDEDQLIDLLTLMNAPGSAENPKNPDGLPSPISSQESLLALKVLKHANENKSRQERELLLKIIWRRCYIRDDWQALNKTVNKTDQHAMEDLKSTTLFKTLYEGYAQGLWEGPSGVRILSPRDVLGSGITAKEQNERFKSPELTERLAKDIAVEDKELGHIIEKFQLEGWAATAKEMAERKWADESATKEEQAKRLGSMTEAIYEDDADLKRGGEQSGIQVPRTWREVVRMGLGY